MSNKAIKDYPKASSIETDDAILIQRGSEYYYVEHEVLANGVIKTTVELSSAQVKTLANSDKTLIAAQGTNVYIHIHDEIAFYSYGGTQYTTQTTVRTRYNGQADADYMRQYTSILQALSNVVQHVNRQETANNRLIPVNTAYNAFATTNPTNGDGTLRFIIWWSKHELV